MADGDISVVFTDLDPDVFATVVPTLEEVAAINRARSEDARGTGQQTFNAETIPTGTEVDLITHLAAKWVFDQLGPDIPDAFLDRARASAAMYAAALVEGTAHQPRESLMRLWNDSAKTGVDAIALRMKELAAGDVEGPSGDAIMPAYSFPVACPLPDPF